MCHSAAQHSTAQHSTAPCSPLPPGRCALQVARAPQQSKTCKVLQAGRMAACLTSHGMSQQLQPQAAPAFPEPMLGMHGVPAWLLRSGPTSEPQPRCTVSGPCTHAPDVFDRLLQPRFQPAASLGHARPLPRVVAGNVQGFGAERVAAARVGQAGRGRRRCGLPARGRRANNSGKGGMPWGARLTGTGATQPDRCPSPSPAQQQVIGGGWRRLRKCQEMGRVMQEDEAGACSRWVHERGVHA